MDHPSTSIKQLYQHRLKCHNSLCSPPIAQASPQSLPLNFTNTLLPKPKTSHNSKQLDKNKTVSDPKKKALSANTRKCPNPACRHKIFRDDGCEMLTCSNCLQRICSSYRGKLSSEYIHFLLEPRHNPTILAILIWVPSGEMMRDSKKKFSLKYSRQALLFF